MIVDKSYNDSFVANENVSQQYLAQIQTYFDSIKDYYNSEIERLKFENHMMESHIKSLVNKINILEEYCKRPWYKKFKQFKSYN